MVTYLELNGEPEWGREFVPPNLQKLVDALRAHFGVGPLSIGCKGDNRHLRGYHRSDEWLANSVYCTNRTYSRSETPGNREPGDRRWLCGLDIGGLPQATLIAMCRRLDEAVRSGRFEKITEWYGNLGGDDRVDGFNNIVNRLATSDSSHLTHAHLSFDRARANEDHSDLLAVLIGSSKEGDDDAMFLLQGDDDDGYNGQPVIYQCNGIERVALTGPGTPNSFGTFADLVKSGMTLVSTTRAAASAAGRTMAQHLDALGGVLVPRFTRPSDILAAIAAIGTAPGGGATPDQVREIVDEELDEQSLGGADPD